MRRFIYILLLFAFTRSMAQSYPVFSQYLYNKLLINPAFAGMDNVLSADLFYRNQWIGLNGAPTFQTFVAHTPLRGQKAGFGLVILNEKRGVFHQDQVYANYSYKITNGEKHLAFGLRAGFHYMNANWKNISTIEPDAAFSEATPSAILPNFGAGVCYYTQQYFLSLSVPYLLTYVSTTSHNGFSIKNDFSNYTYLLNWGINIRSAKYRITPSMLLKYNNTVGEQIDMNVMVYLFKDKLGIGNSIRLHDAYALLVDYQINPQLRTGFCYDYPISKLSRYSSGSIEFVLRYVFHYKIQSPNPRYL